MKKNPFSVPTICNKSHVDIFKNVPLRACWKRVIDQRHPVFCDKTFVISCQLLIDYCDIFVRFHGVPKALHCLMTDAFFSIIIMATSVLIFYNLSSSCTLVNIHCDNLKMLYLLAITYFFYIKCFVYFVCFCISFNIQKILYKTGLNFLDTNLLKK